MFSDFFEKVYFIGIIPVIEIDNADHALPLAEALLLGGLPFAEITMRTDAAINSIQKIAERIPDFIVGAGTVINQEQAKAAIGAGAQFIVSPGFSQNVYTITKENVIPMIPGVITSTEVINAIDQGLKYLKFFPSESMGGLKTIKSITAPFPGIRLIPTGGINIQNLRDYLQTDRVHAVGGSWMANRKSIKECRFDQITQNTRDAMKIISQIRKRGDNQEEY